MNNFDNESNVNILDSFKNHKTNNSINSLAILGTQFGDEGKGKFVDLLSKNFDYIVRYQGGDNAGHTIVFNNKKFKLRLIPSGIFHPNKKVIIAHGTVINPITLLSEIEYLNQNKIPTNNLIISDRCHVIFEYHIEMDYLLEKLKENKIGTTKRGIGPCYTDKASRFGIRICDLFNYKNLKEKITENLKIKNVLFKNFNKKTFDVEEVTKQYFEIGLKIKPYVTDTISFLHIKKREKKSFLFEGAQGLLLDIDFGTYPFVTSSNVTGLLQAGTGFPKIDRILGIVKAYNTRVGEGPFVSEILNEDLAQTIRDKGNEYGTVTKRPRRIGWLDLVSLKYSINISGVTSIALTLTDVLTDLKEIFVCISYVQDNQIHQNFPPSIDQLSKQKPIFKKFKGWNVDISKITKYEDLPIELKNYVLFIETYLNVPVKFVSVGPDRLQTIERENVKW